MPYSGNPANYPASFPLLSDGTPPAAVQTNVPLEALGDRTEYLKVRADQIEPLREASGFPPFTTPRSRVRAVSMQNFAITSGLAARAKTAPFAPFGGANFSTDTDNASIASGCFTFLKTPGATTTQGIQICIDPFVHDGATLAAVRISLQAAAGHAGMTLTTAAMGIFRKTMTAATLLSLRTAGDFTDDPMASTATYQAQHDLALGCDQNNVINTSQYSYFVQIWNELGTHSLPGLKVYGLELTHDSINDTRFP